MGSRCVVTQITDNLAKLEASGDVPDCANQLRQLILVHPDHLNMRLIRWAFELLEESYQFVSDLEAKADLTAFTRIKLLIDTLCPPKR